MSYLYSILKSNLEEQVIHWRQRGDREARSGKIDEAQRWRDKADGLGYALRLLEIFADDFAALGCDTRPAPWECDAEDRRKAVFG